MGQVCVVVSNIPFALALDLKEWEKRDKSCGIFFSVRGRNIFYGDVIIVRGEKSLNIVTFSLVALLFPLKEILK